MQIINTHNTVKLVEEISPQDLTYLIGGLTEGKRIVVVNSPGGTILGLHVAKAVFEGREITTIGAGAVHSSALDVFMYGTRRLATPSSTFMFHRCYRPFEGHMATAAEFLQRYRIACDTGSLAAADFFCNLIYLQKNKTA